MITKIQFKIENDNATSVAILQDGKQVGRIWSEHKDGTTPYPHDKTERTLNSIQLCGFDRQSEVWSCGPFEGKKDCCFTFINNTENESSLIKYKMYVEGFIKSNNPMTALKSFNDWRLHNY